MRYDIAVDGAQDMIERPPVDDLQDLYLKGFEVYGVLSACPCNTFSQSGTRWWKPRHDAPNRELVEQMETLVIELPERERRVFVMRCLCDASFEEIAAELGQANVATTRSLYSRLMTRLFARLADPPVA